MMSLHDQGLHLKATGEDNMIRTIKVGTVHELDHKTNYSYSGRFVLYATELGSYYIMPLTAIRNCSDTLSQPGGLGRDIMLFAYWLRASPL